ncbi:hypothetical protein [Halovivax sp.]|uniref:hypothetical protein n=1 Tax=Halovivax sp. TaxID=1935978 RepID=UPI0025B87DF6|nr:hypothetical protein [Halovivax sp.]
MTSIRDLFGEAVGFGERYCLLVEERDGTLVADHPIDSSPVDVVVGEGLDRLPERPPDGPILVEIRRRFDGDRVVGEVVDGRCDDPDNA